MTILIGAIANGKAFVGADTLWTWDDNFVRQHHISKFVEPPVEGRYEVLIATAGQDKFTQILEKVLLEHPTLINIHDRASVVALVDTLHSAVKAAGIGDADNNQLPEHDLGFLIASSGSDSLWVIESDYSIMEFKDYVCSGSGGYLGESAMRAMSKAGIFGDGAVQIALETVCDLHPYCGGDIDIREVTLNLDIAPSTDV
tara:strand:- start:75 stop:674 length:600 start_codon:yes stop_codon:yes gene_type:complete